MPQTPNPSYDRPNRLKAREDSVIRWGELLEKFRSVQDRAKRTNRPQSQMGTLQPPPQTPVESTKDKAPAPEASRGPSRPLSAADGAVRNPGPAHKAKSSLGNFSRLTSSVGAKKAKK